MSRAPLAMLGAVLALAACSETTPAAEPFAGAGVPAATGFENQTWELETVNGALFSPRPVRAQVEFSGSTYTFSGQCNTHTGSYRVDGGMLALTPGEATAVACADLVDGQFLGLVDQANQLRVTRAGLVLYTADGKELQFRPI